MTSEEMIRGLDATIDDLLRRHATEEEIEDAVRALYADKETA